MQNQKKLKEGGKRRISIIEGIISVSTRGVGYVVTEGLTEDVEILSENLFTALNGDTIKIELLPKIKNERQRGRVIAIIKRSRLEFVGSVVNRESMILLVPDDKRVNVTFSLPADSVKFLGYKVLVKMAEWKDQRKNPTASIIRVIGLKGANDTEMESIVLERGFETNFPAEVENEAEKIRLNGSTILLEEAKHRRDFRNIPTFTVDPVDAKDFDDALSIKDLSKDEVEVGIHIADVAFFVTPQDSLDREAQKRGVSIYLVDRTIPMLPEALSNDLCSLNPNEDKLAFSAVFVLDHLGHVKKSWFGRTIIKSTKRFSYEEAQEIIDKNNGIFLKELLWLNNVAKKLHKRRSENGAISFEQDEVKFELDESGRPIRVFRKKRLDTHKLIEEFMLLANKEVANFVHQGGEKHHKAPLFVYRVHDLPNQEKITELSIFLKAIGYELVIRNGQVTGKDINALFKKIEGEAEEGIIKTAAIRSMAKAIYSTKNIGHFGLGFEYYTHFTSPIRRYPDILVHRLLSQYLVGKKPPEHEFIFYEKLAAITTDLEIRAAEAERDSIKLKQVEFMKERIGKIYEGIISGVTDWGIYIEEKETKCEGMVKLRDLTDDYYMLDAKNYRLVGTRTKKKYALGDMISFIVAGADVERKTLDYKLI